MAGSSALVLLLTRADSPAHTEDSLRALLGSVPAALKVPLVLLTTAPDLHQGVQQWLQTLPGKPPHHTMLLTHSFAMQEAYVSHMACTVLKLAKHCSYTS